MNNRQVMTRIRRVTGFIAAFDQSGGSTPKTLTGFGLSPDAWSSDEEMRRVARTVPGGPNTGDGDYCMLCISASMLTVANAVKVSATPYGRRSVRPRTIAPHVYATLGT